MSEDIMKAVIDQIKSHDSIIISRHKRPDGDAVGSTKGLAGIIRLSFPQKDVRVVNEDWSDYLAFLGKEDKMPETLSGALVIVLDTGNVERISNSRYAEGSMLIKIDHHINNSPYGDLQWVEDQRSSVCEMIADLACSNPDVLKMDEQSATALYTGMVTDTGRFKFDSTGPRTMALASFLLEKGVDIETLFSRLYMEDFSFLKFQAAVFSKMKITENGVAYLIVTPSMQARHDISFESACNCVSFLDSIKGSLIYLAFIYSPSGDIRVRLRSRFLAINTLAEKYGGGGHEKAAGATVKTRAQAMALIADADRMLGEFKRSHEDLL